MIGFLLHLNGYPPQLKLRERLVKRWLHPLSHKQLLEIVRFVDATRWVPSYSVSLGLIQVILHQAIVWGENLVKSSI